jgi:hypothetical protein
MAPEHLVHSAHPVARAKEHSMRFQLVPVLEQYKLAGELSVELV